VGKPAQLDPSQWVERYGDYLFRFAMLRLRDRSAAEDLVQEALVAALKSRDSFSGGSSEATWLAGILKHKIADHFRTLAREAPLAEADLGDRPDLAAFDGAGRWVDGPRAWDGDPAELAGRNEFVEQFLRCLARLSPNHANAFTLREIEGADTVDICKVLNVSETNLWVILHRARMLLRRCLEAHWFTRRAGDGNGC
jgi:RNA polymerase sigma-70 factor, ECF subfamily